MHLRSWQWKRYILLLFTFFYLNDSQAQLEVGEFKLKVKENSVLKYKSDKDGYLSINHLSGYKYNLSLHSPEFKFVSSLEVPFVDRSLGDLQGVQSLDDRFIWYYTTPYSKDKIDGYVLLKKENAKNGKISGINLTSSDESVFQNFTSGNRIFTILKNKEKNEIVVLEFTDSNHYKKHRYELTSELYKELIGSKIDVDFGTANVPDQNLITYSDIEPTNDNLINKKMDSDFHFIDTKKFVVSENCYSRSKIFLENNRLSFIYSYKKKSESILKVIRLNLVTNSYELDEIILENEKYQGLIQFFFVQQ